MEKGLLSTATHETDAVYQARILLVGGIAEERHLVKKLCAGRGIQVKETASATEARRCLEAFRPDAIVVFAELPGGSAWDLCKELRADPRLDWTVLVVVGEPESPDKAGIDGELVDGVLQRPVSAGELVDFVAQRIARLGRLRGQTIRDELTGCYTRRFFDERLAEEVERYHRYGHIFSVVMSDLDDFKLVNDTHGHAVGDLVLRHFGAFLTGAFRKCDLVARYGGEEFVILMPHTAGGVARKVADRVREEWQKQAIRDPRNAREIRVTFSAGVAEVGHGKSTAEDILICADRALYAAKNAGKNVVLLTSEAVQLRAGPASSVLIVGKGFLAHYMAGQIERWGYKTRVASVQEAAAAVQALQAETHGIVLFDVDATSEWPALLRGLKAAAPGVKVLATSNSRDRKTVFDVYNSGADDFIAKPFTVDELEESALTICPWEEGCICTRPFNLESLRRRLRKLAQSS
ncbi:MAG: diguanylate cyclase [Bacillota bacterium]